MKDQQHANCIKRYQHRFYGICCLEAALGEIKTLRIFSTFQIVFHRPWNWPKHRYWCWKGHRNKSTTSKGKLTSQSYISSSSKRAVQLPRKAVVKMPHLLYSWRGLDCCAAVYKGRDYCYIAVCFSEYAFQCCRKFSNVLPTAISGFSNSKEFGNWCKQDVLCGGLWLKILLYRYDNLGTYGRTVVFHTALWQNSECTG